MAESILIDSDILIDHLRKEKHALDFLETEIETGAFFFVSVISRVEIYAGIRKGEEGIVKSLFEMLTSVDVDAAIADRAGEYLQKFGKGHALNIGDSLIAATAREMRLRLVTRNVKHYPMKDIEVFKPY
ncbi:MAG: type II toxin-antitoxin system VapC family toxin [Candidatus Omnitrophica bacterium]|nr:type II toxin-antitoxin system VapC family toxin [Candidatus Omnitrophota bacterium]